MTTKLLFVILLLVVLFTSTIYAEDSSATLPKWEGDEPVFFCIDKSAENFRIEVTFAFFAWIQYLNLRGAETTDCNSPRTIAVSVKNFGDDDNFVAMAIGPAGALFAEPIAGDIFLSPKVPWETGRGWLAGVLLHEMGHSFGLNHSDDPLEVMHPNYASQVEPKLVPKREEIEKLKKLYQKEQN